MQWELKNNKFYFRCNLCDCILSSEFEEEEDIKDLKEFKLWIECPHCENGNGKCFLLTD